MNPNNPRYPFAPGVIDHDAQQRLTQRRLARADAIGMAVLFMVAMFSLAALVGFAVGYFNLMELF